MIVKFSRVSFVFATIATVSATSFAFAQQKMRVALLLPGKENDHGWNQLAFEAAKSLETDGTATLSHTNAPNATAFKSDLRDYAQQGYDLIICHGGEFAKAAREIARQFPKSHIVVTGSAEGGDGIASLDFQLWQATYLCGVLAAKLSPDGPAGVVGGQNFSTVKNTLDAFVNGARSVRPGYKADFQYVGSWDDVAKAKQTARSLIDTYKSRVIFQNTDAAAAGIFDAAKEASPDGGNPIFVFGCNSDQSPLGGAIVPASAVIDMKAAFHQLAETVRAGKFEPKVYGHDLKTGGVGVVLNPAFKDRWPAGALDSLAKAREAIVSGKIDVLKP